MKRKPKTVFRRLQVASAIVLVGLLVLWIKELDIAFLARYAVMVMAVVAFSAVVMGIEGGVTLKRAAGEAPYQRAVWVLCIIFLVALPGFLFSMVTAFSAYQQVAHQHPLHQHALIEGLSNLWGKVFFATSTLASVVLIAWGQFRRRGHTGV